MSLYDKIGQFLSKNGLLAGSMVLSNVNERLSNIDEHKMFTVLFIH